MFTATNCSVVLALTLCFVASAEAQQRGQPQRGCLTPREAFQVNEPGAKLCPPQAKATPPATGGVRGATSPTPTTGTSTQTTPTTATPGNKEPVQPVEPARPPERGSQNPTVVLVSLPSLVLKYSFLKSSSTGE